MLKVVLYGKVTHSVECCVISVKLVSTCMHIFFGSKVIEAGSVSYKSTSYRCCPVLIVDIRCDMG